MPRRINESAHVAKSTARREDTSKQPRGIEKLNRLEPEAQVTAMNAMCEAAGIPSMGQYADDYTKESHSMTRRRLDMRIDYERYITGPHRRAIEAKSPAQRTQQELKDLTTEPLDFSNAGPLLNAARAKSFMRALVVTCEARKHDRPTIGFITCKLYVFFAMVRAELREQKIPHADIATILGDRRDYEGSFRGMVGLAVSSLIDEFKLVPRDSDQVVYGRPELELLLVDQMGKLVASANATEFEATLQLMLAMVLCFITALRIGALGKSGTETNLDGMLAECVTFTRDLEQGALDDNPLAWHGHLHVEHVKGFQGDNESRDSVHVHLDPVEQVENILLEPAMWLLILLMLTGRLREHDTKKPITSVEELVASKARKLEGFGGPLFRNKDGTFVTAHTLDARLHAAALRVKLPPAGFHAFRRDVAKQTALALGPAAVMAILHHGMKRNTTERNYVGAIANIDLVGTRTGKRLTQRGRDALDQGRYYCKQLQGVASEAAASYFSAADVSSPLLLAPPAKKQRAVRGSGPTWDEKLERALKEQDKVKDGLAKYNAAVEELLKSLPPRIGGPRTKFSPQLLQPLSPLSSLTLTRLLRYLDDHPAAKQAAKTAHDTARQLRKDMDRTAGKIERERRQAAGQGSSRRSANQSAAPEAGSSAAHLDGRQALQNLSKATSAKLTQAGQARAAASASSSSSSASRPAPSTRSRSRAAAALQQAQVSSASRSRAGESFSSARPVDEDAMDVDAEWEAGSDADSGDEQDDYDDADDAPFDPTLNRTDKGSGGDKLVTSHARLAVMEWLVKIGQGLSGFAALVEHITSTCVCRLCAPTVGLAPRSAATWTTLPAQGTKLSSRRGHVREHLEQTHEDVCAAVKSGERMELGILASEAPVYIPDLVQERAPEVAARFAMPFAFDDEESPRPDEIMALMPMPSLFGKTSAERKMAAAGLARASAGVGSNFGRSEQARKRSGNSLEWAMSHAWPLPAPGGKALPEFYRLQVDERKASNAHFKRRIPYVPASWATVRGSTASK